MRLAENCYFDVGNRFYISTEFFLFNVRYIRLNCKIPNENRAPKHYETPLIFADYYERKIQNTIRCFDNRHEEKQNILWLLSLWLLNKPHVYSGWYRGSHSVPTTSCMLCTSLLDRILLCIRGYSIWHICVYCVFMKIQTKSNCFRCFRFSFTTLHEFRLFSFFFAHLHLFDASSHIQQTTRICETYFGYYKRMENATSLQPICKVFNFILYTRAFSVQHKLAKEKIISIRCFFKQFQYHSCFVQNNPIKIEMLLSVLLFILWI